MKQSWVIEADPRVISIVGPTASGKTALAIGLARRLKETRGQRCEIINQDAYQMYRRMDIGTAKPSAAELAAVPHHLIDVIDPSCDMNAALFQKMAREQIAECLSRGVRPILVGGSGLYARVAIDRFDFAGRDPQIRQRLEARVQTEGVGALYEELRATDPKAAETIGPTNERRIIRALESIAVTGEPYSSHLPTYEYAIACVQIGLDVPRAVIDDAIDRRTEAMRAAGFVQEVAAVRSELSATAERALGYRQIEDYLDGKCSQDEAFALIARKTKRLARKQMGWFGRDPRIHWLDAADSAVVDAAARIIEQADFGAFDACDLGPHAPTVRHLGAVNGGEDVAINR